MIKSITEDTIERALLGLPLEEALSILKNKNIDYAIQEYSSLRGIENAEDKRVLRVRIKDGCAYIVVSVFLTEI